MADSPQNENDTPPPPPEENANSLSISFRSANGEEVHFKLKKTTMLKKAMDAFAARVQRERSTLRFLFEGERVQNDSTAELLEMADGDVIDVHTEQIGGNIMRMADLTLDNNDGEDNDDDQDDEGDDDSDIFSSPLPPRTRNGFIVTFRSTNGDKIYFEISLTTRLGKAIDAWCARFQQQRSDLRFVYDGQEVQDDHTAERFGIGHGCVVNVEIKQDKHIEEDVNIDDTLPPPELYMAGSDSITVTFRSTNSYDEVHFKVRTSTRLGKAIGAYCARVECKRSDLRFVFQGNRVHEEDTAEWLGIEEGSVVEVHMQQDGSHGSEEDLHDSTLPLPPLASTIVPNSITITFKDVSGVDFDFVINKSTHLIAAMDCYAARFEHKLSNLRFLFNGGLVAHDSTVEMLGMKNGDVVEVLRRPIY